MIVLTAGPASLVRLMRRDHASQHLAAGQVDDPQNQGDQAEAAAPPLGRIRPSSLFSLEED